MSAGHRDFIERTLRALADTMERATRAEHTGHAAGFLQRLDPRVKVVGFLIWIIAAAASRDLAVTAAWSGLGALLAISSGAAVLAQTARVWCGVMLFTGAMAAPALCSVPGPPCWQLPWSGWTITTTGLHVAAGLLARAEATATFACLIVLTTPWPHLLKALRVLRAPATLVLLLGMTYRYIFLLLRTAGVLFEARRARLIGRPHGRLRRQLAVTGAAVLLEKSSALSGDVHDAMIARGFRGDVRTLDQFHMKPLDRAALAVMILLAAAAILRGRIY